MKLQTVDPKTIELHPALQALPLSPPEVVDLIIADVCLRGIDVPLVLNESGELLDGRIRLRGALAAGHAGVPCVRRPDGDSITVILSSLCQRKHYTKGALAYVSFPLFAGAVKESRTRRVANLKRGAGSPDSALSALSASAEEVSEKLGLARRLFFQAQEIHKLFTKHPDARQHFEPQILAGEIGLGAAIAGVAGFLATNGKARGVNNTQTDFFKKLFGSIVSRFSRFEKLSKHEQTYVAHEFAMTADEWPAPVLEAVERKLRALKKEGALS